MILSELLGTFRDLANNHTQIEGFYTGLVEEHNDSLIQYPALRISFPYNALASQDDDVLSYTFDLTLLVNDLIEDVGNEITGPSLYEVNTNFNSQQDELNEIDTDLVDENLLRERAISIMAQYIQGVRNLEEEPQYFVVQDGWNIQSLERYGNDSATGCKVTLTISVANDYKCQSIANIDERIWRNSNVNQLTMPDFICPDCPDTPFPTDCNDLLAELSVTQLNDCILPTYDFSDTVVQNSTTVVQQNDMSSWLCPVVTPPTQYSMLFDGVDEYINCYNNPVYSFTKNSTFTISCWFRVNNISGIKTLVAKRLAFGQPLYGLFLVNDLLRFSMRDNLGNDFFVACTTPISANTWYHIAVTYDGTITQLGTKLYVNDVLQTTTLTGAIVGTIGTTGNLGIGGSTVGLITNGYIGHTRIWNTVLTPLQVSQDYNLGKMNNENVLPISSVLDFKSGQNDLFSGTNWVFNDASGSNINPSIISVNMEFTDRTTVIP